MADLKTWTEQQRNRNDDIGRCANMTLEQINSSRDGVKIALATYHEFNQVFPTKAEPMAQPVLADSDLTAEGRFAMRPKEPDWGPLMNQPIGNTVEPIDYRNMDDGSSFFW